MNQGILCNITPSVSIVQDSKNNLIKENGCNIKFTKFPKNSKMDIIWNKLKNEYDLKCAHFEIPNKFNGCINNYFKKSSCYENEKSNI